MKDGERSGKKDREKNRRKVSNDTASITTEPPPPSGSSSSLLNFISLFSQVLSHSFLSNLSPLTLFSHSLLLPFFFQTISSSFRCPVCLLMHCLGMIVTTIHAKNVQNFLPPPSFPLLFLPFCSLSLSLS